MQTIGQDYHPLDVLVYQYLNHNERAASNSVKQEELAFAKVRAFCDGLSAGITEILNQARIEHYRKFLPDLRFIPAVDNWRVSKELWDRRRLFKELSSQVASKELHEKKSQFQQQVIDFLFSLVSDEGLDAHAEQARRDRVLIGTEDPQPGDKEWLATKVAEVKAIAAPAELALAKLGDQ